ncbi:MAG TPA: protein-L-isoaspartate(D-aspartate) O-methyltransferase [Planctomycetaceae bacterium]|nr:protein-L-isoaspartate(D-aspartate) O-methyltransferase [Planctomycetaceae bacterium]
MKESLLWAAVCACWAGPAVAQTDAELQRARQQMVTDFIEQEGVRDRRVLEAMRTVPRHEFVPRPLRAQAYWDAALAIGHGQTISPPFVVAYMTETIDPRPEDRVLEIGTGSGYQAAILSGLAKEVYTIEIVEPLGRAAERRLKQLRYDNVHVKVGDGYQGWPEHAPFDKIIVTCSPESVPTPLVEQLKDGGRMIIPLGERYQQTFYLFEKRGGELVEQKLIPTLFVPMTGISEAERQVKPDPARPELVNGGFELDENQDGRADNWHYQRQASLETDDAPQGRQYVCFDNDERGRLAQLLQGMALDGRQVRSVEVSVQVKYERLASGPSPLEKPALVLTFYDDTRRVIGNAFIGPWEGRSDWRQVSKQFDVPAKAREAILRIGLNGGTGRLCVDDVRLVPRR